MTASVMRCAGGWCRAGRDAERAVQHDQRPRQDGRRSRCSTSAFRRRRCLIPASGCERMAAGRRWSPAVVHTPARRGQGLLAFGGVWEHWAGDGAEPFDSVAIIVTAAAPSLQPIHDRMPVLIEAPDYEGLARSREPRRRAPADADAAGRCRQRCRRCGSAPRQQPEARRSALHRAARRRRPPAGSLSTPTERPAQPRRCRGTAGRAACRSARAGRAAAAAPGSQPASRCARAPDRIRRSAPP